MKTLTAGERKGLKSYVSLTAEPPLEQQPFRSGRKQKNMNCSISSGNLVTTFKIKGRQGTPKLQESVTGMSQELGGW